MNAFKHIFAALIAAASLISCEVSGVIDPTAANDDGSPVFTASFEDTRVFLDSEMHTCWNEKDLVSIFSGWTNTLYWFAGQTGDRTGYFTYPSYYTDPAYTHLDKELSANYAIYPYNRKIVVNDDESFVLNLPFEQPYAQDSFGPGANTMIAATRDTADHYLEFKNIGCCLVVKVYGEGTVLGVSLEGNDNEPIAGNATVKAVYGAEPIIAMNEDATSKITVMCRQGVELGRTPDEATAFWFVVRPVDFEKGITVKILGDGIMQSVFRTHSPLSLKRNLIYTADPVEAVFDTLKDGTVDFYSETVKRFCVKNFDRDGDNDISYNEALDIDSLSITGNLSPFNRDLNFLVNLRVLDIRGNNFKYLDLSRLPHLKKLDCSINNSISNLDLSYCDSLEYVNCCSAGVSSLNLSNSRQLVSLSCGGNSLTSLDISECDSLAYLDCSENRSLIDLKLDSSSSLVYLNARRTMLTDLDASDCCSLDTLNVSDSVLENLNISGCSSLSYLNCTFSSISSIDLSGCGSLSYLDCSNSKVRDLLLDGASSLSYLDCHRNLLTTIDISRNAQLTTLYCQDNSLSSIDLRANATLKRIDISNNKIAVVDLSNCGELACFYCSGNRINALDFSHCPMLEDINCDYNGIRKLEISSNVALAYLSCSGNSISSLDLSTNLAVKKVYCGYNSMKTLSTTNCKELTLLFCYGNKLSKLDLSDNIAVTRIWCDNNNLIDTLDIRYNPNLIDLSCANNPRLKYIRVKIGRIPEGLNKDPGVKLIY